MKIQTGRRKQHSGKHERKGVVMSQLRPLLQAEMGQIGPKVAKQAGIKHAVRWAERTGEKGLKMVKSRRMGSLSSKESCSETRQLLCCS